MDAAELGRGRTDRIRLATNVRSLPLRAPAVLARSAASLDLLSGGRLDLTLGDSDGAFSDAITAMGGHGEAVDALSEAIDVIRGVLDAGQPSRLTYTGEQYQLHGAERGPLPVHQIRIWLGGYTPDAEADRREGRRMARIAG